MSFRTDHILSKALWPLCLALGFVGVYLLTWQQALFDDGIFFTVKLHNGDLVHNHILYLPLSTALRYLVSCFVEISAENTIKLLETLCAGITVAFAFLIAHALIGSRILAACAALLLGFLPGFWFFATTVEIHALHSACAALLLYAFVRVLVQPDGKVPRWSLIAGAALTPASHMTGIVALLPTACTAWLSKKHRFTIVLYVAVGFGLVAIPYIIIFLFEDDMNAYAGHYTKGYIRMLEDPVRLVKNIRNLACELFLHSIPASTLLPVGLWILFRRSPKVAWLFLSWIVAWPAVGVTVFVAIHGGYYMPTFCVQSICAIIAFKEIARTPMRAFLGAVLAITPGILNLQSEVFALIAFALCATALFKMVSLEKAQNERRLIVLPLTGLLFTGLTCVPHFFEDPTRDLIRKTEQVAGNDNLVFLVEPDYAKHRQWDFFFRRDPEAKGRLLDLTILMALPEEQVKSRQKAFSQLIRKNIQEGRKVFLAGALEFLDIETDVEVPVLTLVSDLETQFGLHEPQGGGPGILCVGPADQ